jgi:hypothetical protein
MIGQGVGPRAGLVLRQHLALDLHVGDTVPARRGQDDLRQACYASGFNSD